MRFLNINFELLKLSSFSMNKSDIAKDIRMLSKLFRRRINRYKLLEITLANVTDWKYATGGTVVQRGYFSPLLYETMTIGGCNRGRLLKRITEKSNVSYEYGFEDNQIIVATQYNGKNSLAHTYEYIEQRENIEIGILFGINRGKCDGGYNKPIQIIVSQYENGKLINTRVLQNPEFFIGKIIDWDYSRSWYHYNDEGRLYQIEYVDGNKHVMQHKIVTVICDEDGCPNQYYFDERDIHNVSENNKQYYKEMYLKDQKCKY